MQTYEIYINESRLTISDKPKAENKNDLMLHFHGKLKIFYQIIDSMEKANSGYKDVFLISRDPYNTFQYFKSIYDIIRASGGLIINNRGEILFIFRRGHWDLPKGKMDPGESELETAFREIEEEVGLSKLQNAELMGHTWHTYKPRKSNRILKRTAWFIMKIVNKETIQLQAEEDIEAYHWIAPKLFLDSDLPSFRSVRELVKSYLENY